MLPRPLLLLLPLLAAACAAPRPLPRPPVPPEAAALARRAEVLLQEERVEEALEAALEAVARYPGSPDTLRVLQNVRLVAGRDAEARADAERAVEERPDDPVALYLLARTEIEGSRSEPLLRRALDADPGLTWARLGLAQVLLGRRDLSGAARELARAEALDPGRPWTAFLEAQVALAAEDPAGALARLRECIRRDPGWYRGHEALARQLARIPGEEGAARASLARAFHLAPRSRTLAAAWREALEEGAPPEDLQAAVAAVDAAAAAGGGGLPPPALHLRGKARLLLGDPAAALPDLEAAARSGEERTASLDDLRLALFLLERYAESLAWEVSLTPAGLLEDPTSSTDLRRLLLQRAVGEATARPRDPDALGRLADLCRRTGWLREASLLADRRAALAPEDPAAREEAAECRRTLRFLEELRLGWKGAYHGYAAGGEGEGLAGALASLRALSLRVLGLDVTAGMARRSYALLGDLADSVRAEGACREWFDAHGLALLVGQASGEPVEARLLRVVALHRDAERESLGRRFRATVVVGEGLLVPSRREAGGAVLGGATVADLVFVDLEGVARWSGAASRSRRDPALRSVLASLPAGVPESLEGADPFRFPGRLSERTALAVPRWDDPVEALSDFLDAATAHELAHAADAARYLPVTSHLLEGLGLLLRSGFSASSAASLLEGDAEIAAMAGAREPRASLATLTSFLPAREAGAPHGAGYFGALEELVEVLRERGLLPPGPEGVRGLDRVDPAALGSAAREVCRRRGLLGDRRE